MKFKFHPFFITIIIIIVKAKVQNHIMGLGLHTGRLAMSEERKWMPKGPLAQLS